MLGCDVSDVLAAIRFHYTYLLIKLLIWISIVRYSVKASILVHFAFRIQYAHGIEWFRWLCDIHDYSKFHSKSCAYNSWYWILNSVSFCLFLLCYLCCRSSGELGRIARIHKYQRIFAFRWKRVRFWRFVFVVIVVAGAAAAAADSVLHIFVYFSFSLGEYSVLSQLILSLVERLLFVYLSVSLSLVFFSIVSLYTLYTRYTNRCLRLCFVWFYFV